jgi:hypothetical protein
MPIETEERIGIIAFAREELDRVVAGGCDNSFVG